MRLKKVRGGVKGFGDTLVSKTCHFFRVSRKGAEGGGGRYIWYSTVHIYMHMQTCVQGGGGGLGISKVLPNCYYPNKRPNQNFYALYMGQYPRKGT